MSCNAERANSRLSLNDYHKYNPHCYLPSQRNSASGWWNAELMGMEMMRIKSFHIPLFKAPSICALNFRFNHHYINAILGPYTTRFALDGSI
jgi:hypothetical protein